MYASEARSSSYISSLVAEFGLSHPVKGVTSSTHCILLEKLGVSISSIRIPPPEHYLILVMVHGTWYAAGRWARLISHLRTSYRCPVVVNWVNEHIIEHGLYTVV
jgi:hypothetical protein